VWYFALNQKKKGFAQARRRKTGNETGRRSNTREKHLIGDEDDVMSVVVLPKKEEMKRLEKTF